MKVSIVELCKRKKGHVNTVESKKEQNYVVHLIGSEVRKMSFRNNICLLVLFLLLWMPRFCQSDVDSDGFSEKCDNGYTFLSTGCYLKTGEIKTVNESVELCKTKKGHVVTVESNEEQNDVISLVGNVEGQFGEHTRLLLGVINIGSTLVKKIHDGEMISWSGWAKTEPNGDDETTVAIYLGNKLWYDVPGTWKGRVICEKDAALTSKSTTCKFCGLRNSGRKDILALLDGDATTCIQTSLKEIQPSYFFLGLMNKEQLSAISVGVLAKRCDEPYLSLSAVGSCSSNIFKDCALTSETAQDGMKFCEFACRCNGACACVMATTQTFGGKNQHLCEMRVMNY